MHTSSSHGKYFEHQNLGQKMAEHTPGSAVLTLYVGTTSIKNPLYPDIYFVPEVVHPKRINVKTQTVRSIPTTSKSVDNKSNLSETLSSNLG